MKRLLLSLAAVALAACAVEPNATVTTASGATEIQIRNGMNCYDNACFRYDARTGTVNVAGRRNTSPPAGVNLASGSISTAEFRATHQKALRARTIGGTDR